MRRLLAILAAGLLSVTLSAPTHAQAPAKDQASSVSTGDSTFGTYRDSYYGGPDHYMKASWNSGNQEPVCCGNPVWSELSSVIIAYNLPDTPAGHHTCVQVAMDWRVPTNAPHYDARILRNCDPNSVVDWIFNEKVTQNDPPDCLLYNFRVPCSSPMGRIQFARYDLTTGHTMGPYDCRTMAGVEFHDCLDWDPWGNTDVARIRLRQRDGDISTFGSLDATNASG